MIILDHYDSLVIYLTALADYFTIYCFLTAIADTI